MVKYFSLYCVFLRSNRVRERNVVSSQAYILYTHRKFRQMAVDRSIYFILVKAHIRANKRKIINRWIFRAAPHTKFCFFFFFAWMCLNIIECDEELCAMKINFCVFFVWIQGIMAKKNERKNIANCRVLARKCLF